jgi:hypothetical protein
MAERSTGRFAITFEGTEPQLHRSVLPIDLQQRNLHDRR